MKRTLRQIAHAGTGRPVPRFADGGYVDDFEQSMSAQRQGRRASGLALADQASAESERFAQEELERQQAEQQAVPGFANGGPVAFGSRGLEGLRDMIPKVQAMGYPQAAPQPAAEPRGAARLRALIPQVEAMGYKQASASPEPQYFAEGGFVKRVQQLFGMDPERNARIAAYKNQSAQERAAAAPAPVPAPAPAIADYAGMGATERREKAAGLNNGGHVRGPGTGTSDSIPARLSDGEFVLPADTVQTVGVRRLRDLVRETHTPVKASARKHHYVNGDLVEEPKPNSFGDQAAAARDASVSVVPTGVPAAQSPSLDSRVASIPSGPQSVPTPAADGSQNSLANTEVGRNVANTLSAVPGLGGVRQVAATGGAISSGINAASRAMNATAAAGAATAAAPSLAAASSSPPPAAPEPAFQPRTLASIAAGTSATDTGTPPPAAAPSTSNVTRVGNSYSGANVAGDITVNGQTPRGGYMNTGDTSAARTPDASAFPGQTATRSPVGDRVYFSDRSGSQPSAQNMTAADRLSALAQGESERRVGIGQATGPGSGPVMPGSFTGGFTGVIGSSSTQGNMRGRTPEQRLRDAEVSASSITNTRKWGGKGAENSDSMMAYRAALQRDSNSVQNEAAAELEGMRQTGACSARACSRQAPRSVPMRPTRSTGAGSRWHRLRRGTPIGRVIALSARRWISSGRPRPRPSALLARGSWLWQARPMTIPGRTRPAASRWTPRRAWP